MREFPDESTFRVLIVDDTPRNVTALEAMLQDLDVDVSTAASGPEALRALLRQDFALILLDVRMPGMDGLETAELVRTRDRTRLTPIIFLTAFDRTRDQELRGYALGAVDFLTKPIVPEVLRSKIGVLIDLHRRTEEVRRQAVLLQATQRREHALQLDRERRRWEEEALRREMEQERRSSEELHRANARLRLVSDITTDLLRGTEPAAFAPTLLARVNEHLALEVGAWHEADRDGTLTLSAHLGLPDAVTARLRRVRVGEGPLGEVAQKLEPLVASGAAERFAGSGLRVDVVLPVSADGHLLGVLSFGSASPASFQEDDVGALTIVAERLGAVLERWRLMEQLRQSAADLREADVRKDQFLAMLGHELRNPLAPVLNAVKLMHEREAGDPVLKRVVAAADRQIRHMTRLLDDLLDVSRIRNGKIELRRSRVDLREVLRDAVHATEAAIADRGHALEVDLGDAPLFVDGDPVRLAQVFANLLHNSIKYTDGGGRIAVSAARRSGDAVVSVRDDGIGIDPVMLPRIFDVFVQVEQGSDRAHGGLGLGLTLVRSLVEMHGGQVKARSDGVGLGSEFEVTVPLCPAPAVAAKDATDGVDQEDGGPRPARPTRALDIVIVEDNADIRDSLKALLELRGHSVTEADDGRTGFDLIRARTPSIALIDIGLPGIDGYQVARELRREASCTRLIAMTGYGRPEDRRLALDAGFDAHLVKPVDIDDLARILDQLS